MINKDDFQRYAEAQGVRYAKQAAELADYESGEDMQTLLDKVLEAVPSLREAKTVIEIGSPTNYGTDRMHAPTKPPTVKHVNQLSPSAKAVREAGTIEARVKYAQEKRAASNERRQLGRGIQ